MAAGAKVKHALMGTAWIQSNNSGKNSLDRMKCPKCQDSFKTKQILLDHMITQHCNKKSTP